MKKSNLWSWVYIPMEAAREKAKEGNLDYFGSLDSKALESIVESTDEDDRTLLHTAVSSGSAELVQFLVGIAPKEMVNHEDDEVIMIITGIRQLGNASAACQSESDAYSKITLMQ